MGEKSADKTKLSILNMEEDIVNTIMFAAWVFITVAAFIIVVFVL